MALKFILKPYFLPPILNTCQINRFYTTNSLNFERGALIVFEGCDRAGKTTQCKKMAVLLTNLGHKAIYMNFPDRRTESGALINSYLTNKLEINDEGIHLLFSFNRWEAKEKMEALLNSGITLIVDRYSYSGVAFSAAKGLDMDWCKAPEAGLLKPDLVVLLTLTADEMAKRGGFGNERYEVPEFQKKVLKCFQNLKDDEYWLEVNADKTEENLSKELTQISINCIEKSKHKEIKKLW